MESNAPDNTDWSISLAETTSPSQLQEVTLDQDVTFSNTMGLRSPNGPMRGRSVKEFEEQLTNLKKENFNLKLRIYFLEEKMGTNFTLDKDNVVKKNVELQVEIANLQKEVQEKHELLCQAVKAMELEDEEHKKFLVLKEDELQQYQQELEDLRNQLQETRLDSDGLSIKSDTTGFYSSRATNSGTFISELQEKIRILETELQLEKENNASLQIILGQAETLKCRYETMQKEFQLKDETIKSLGEEIEAANEKILGFTDQIKDLEHKLNSSHKENMLMQKKIQVENKKFEEVMGQLTDLKKKFATAKSDLEREHKRAERVKMMNDMKMSELEEENEKQKLKIRDLQGKLEAALIEIKKNQNLAVSKSPVQKSNSSNTDDNSFSVSNSTTPAGTAKTNTLHVQINHSSKTATSPTSPLSPEVFNIPNFEELLQGAGEQAGITKIRSQFQILINENDSLKRQIVKLKSQQMKACEIIKNMIESRNKATEENNQLKKRIDELEHELESVVSKPTKDENERPLQQRVANMNITAANPNDENSMEESHLEDLEIAEHYKALTVELEAKIEILVATLNEKDVQMQKIRQQYEEILTSLEDKENRIVDLEFELLSVQKDNTNNNSDKVLLEKGDSGSEKHSSFYRHEIEEKDKEIEKLSVELKKCTCYLQEIVNKELWDKNKEIEKLHNKQANSSEVLKLRKDLSEKEIQLKLLKEKISELGLDVNIPTEESFDGKDLSSPSKNIQHIRTLQEQLKLCKEERNYFKEKSEELYVQTEVIEKLHAQNQELKTDIEKCEKLRQESNEVCSILSGRLEELAIFLDSLLKQKSVLGFLGLQKNRRLREIIDNSLDLSRSFTMSMMINPDQSLAQLSNITTLLNGSVFNDLTLDHLPQEEDEPQAVLSIIPANVTLTYQSHLYKQNKNSGPNNEQVISALREQIINLKSELQLRDNELNRLNILNNREVSDKTTETDDDETYNKYIGFKDVSKLFTTPNKCNTTSTTLKYQSECQSESEAWSEPDRVVSRARIGLSHTLPITIRQTKEDINESTEEESGSSCTPTKKNWPEKRQVVVELHQRIYELEDKLKTKTAELLNTQTKFLESNNANKRNLEDLEQKLAETENKLLEAQTSRNEAENQIKHLQQTIEELSKAKRNLEESAATKDKETQNKINQLEVEREEASRMAQDYEKEVANARNVIKSAESKLKQMQQEMCQLEGNLRAEYEQLAIIKLKDAEEQFSKKLKEVEEKAERKLDQIVEEYSKDFIRKIEVEKKLLEVEKLVVELDDVKRIVKSYEETIECYKEKENEIRNRTHEYQDKINSLRKDLDNTTLQYSEAVLEKTKLANEKTLLEQELSKFNMKESEMKQQFSDIQTEFTNVNENYQQQISMLQKQKSKLEMKISELESMNAELHNRLVRFQAGRGDFNVTVPMIGNKHIHVVPFKRQFSDQNYSSEENISFNRPLMQDHQPVDMERHEANSSPDLGIESDHGRFSSLETAANIPRPLLQTIELTESMSNLLDGENQVDNVTCGSEHCCQKTLEIARENGELKRKLLRMRRALEETANQLNLANQRKKQVEKTICKQIHKTSQVLRKAKANLDSGSESDVLNKM
ncbi:centrosomin isoform X2 [Anoplophora glabripennis]|uniref:centrosomin isoform X2 n=1 Tax=Anoplophora glabripennis TaxID=217634 RepID=UPI000873D1B8|nr:centrosomin isoform X2 [Anoplophora glabripennis]